MTNSFDCLTSAWFAPLNLGLAMARIGAEAQTVIALRTAGMVGLWDTPPDELERMVLEKPYAAAQSMLAAGRAIAEGARPDQVVEAALAPIGRKTRANAARLSGRGPKLG